MSNNASLSSVKRRRGGGPPPMPPPPSSNQNQNQNPNPMGNLPPGLPPNFRQLPPQLQQQLLRQLQQLQQRNNQIPPNTPPHSNNAMPQPLATRTDEYNNNIKSNFVKGEPYTVNKVLHNNAMMQISGLHIRDLPMSSAGLPCLPSGGPLPPNVLFKLHHDELLTQDTILNDFSNKIQLLTNRVDKIEKPGTSAVSNNSMYVSTNNTSDTNDTYDTNDGEFSYETLVANSDFISKIVDNILTNTNLSDIINQIEPLQKENESLRLLINSQQTTLNELSSLVMKLINSGLPSYSNVTNNVDDHTNIEGMSVCVLENNNNNNNDLNEDVLQNLEDGGCVDGVGGVGGVVDGVSYEITEKQKDE